MVRLNAAEERLEKAVSALEAALLSRGGGAGEAAELEAMRRERDALRAQAGTVAARLDTTLARLTGVLDGQ